VSNLCAGSEGGNGYYSRVWKGKEEKEGTSSRPRTMNHKLSTMNHDEPIDTKKEQQDDSRSKNTHSIYKNSWYQKMKTPKASSPKLQPSK
jgi:hypothetical protein